MSLTCLQKSTPTPPPSFGADQPYFPWLVTSGHLGWDCLSASPWCFEPAGDLWTGHFPDYSGNMIDTVAKARQLIWIVASDTKLPRYVRSEAASLELLVAPSPDLVYERLELLRRKVLPDLVVEPPTVDYVRCVSVEVFYRHHIRPSRRDFFRTPEDYRRHFEDMPNPAEAAQGDLNDDEILVPSANCWLVPADRIAGLRGASIKSRLQIEQKPPYIVMIFPVELMRVAKVEIREPCGIDVIPRKLVRWSSGDVPDERIDQDIPLSALGGLEWRP